MTDKTCPGCGETFTPARPSAVTCSDRCRQRVKRATTGRVTVTDDRPVTDDVIGRGDVEAAVTEWLANLTQLETPRGRIAVALSRRLDLGVDVGSALAAAARELSSILADLEANAPQRDIVTMLQERRERRRAGLEPDPALEAEYAQACEANKLRRAVAAAKAPVDLAARRRSSAVVERLP